jgi:hypothetical protein
LGVVLPIVLMLWLIIQPFKTILKALAEGFGEGLAKRINKSLIERIYEKTEADDDRG